MAALKKVEFTIGVRDRTRRALRTVTRRLRGLGRAARGVATRIAAIATAGFAVLAVGALKTAKNLVDLSQQLRFSTRFLQAFQNAAREGGASVESAATFLQRFTTNLGKARAGQVSFVKAFADAGISGRDLLGEPLDVLDQLLENVKDLDQVSRQAIVSPIGDVEGVKAINALLGQQLDSVEKIGEFGQGLGIIPRSVLDRLDGIATDFFRAFQSIKPALFDTIATVLEQVVKALPSITSAIIDFLQRVPGLVKSLVATTKSFIAKVPQFIESIEGFVNAVKALIGFFSRGSNAALNFFARPTAGPELSEITPAEIRAAIDATDPTIQAALLRAAEKTAKNTRRGAAYGP